MRDGVVLRADVYRPDTPERLPALLERTPYSKSTRSRRTTSSAAWRRTVMSWSSRTRADATCPTASRVPHDEGADGYDTIEWVATLPSRERPVGTFGGSYAATTQLLAAPLQPPHLVAIFPSSSYNSRYDMVFQGGAFYLADGLSWNLGQGADVRRRMLHPERRPATDRSGWTQTERQMLREQLAVACAAEDDRRDGAAPLTRRRTSRCSAIRRTTRSGRHSTSSRRTANSTSRPSISPAGTTRCSTARCETSPACGNTRAPSARAGISVWSWARGRTRGPRRLDDDWRRRFRTDRRLPDSNRLMFDWFDYWLKGRADQRPVARAGAPVRDGCECLAR